MIKALVMTATRSTRLLYRKQLILNQKIYKWQYLSESEKKLTSDSDSVGNFTNFLCLGTIFFNHLANFKNALKKKNNKNFEKTEDI